jgi:hypothetical protein
MEDYLGSGTLEEIIAGRIADGLKTIMRDEIKKKVLATIDELAKESFQATAQQALTDFFERKMQKTDQWGNPVSKAESLQELFIKQFDTFINQKVRAKDGAEVNYSSDPSVSRISYMISTMAHKPMQDAITEKVKEISDIARTQIQASVSRYITDQLAPTISVPQLKA